MDIKKIRYREFSHCIEIPYSEYRLYDIRLKTSLFSFKIYTEEKNFN